MKKSIAYLALFLAATLTFACKKVEDNVERPSLLGIDLEEEPLPYVAPGTTVTLKADVSYIYTSDNTTPDKPIGLCWSVNKGKADTLTRDIKASNPAFSYTAQETGEVSITLYAFSEGYNSTSASTSYSAIDPETSLSGLTGKTTEIGGSKFYVAEIDGTTWMANNLYGTNSGISFYLSSVTDSFLGRFYTWKEALTACPQGWRLPTADEWDKLGNDACALMTDATLLEKQMWAYWPGMNITNAKGFNAIPAGYVDRAGGDSNVQGFKDYAIFWTASESTDPSLAQFRYIYADKTEVQKGNGSKESLALSVRCIKE